MKRLLSLIIFIGSFACAMDAPSKGEPPKKKQRTNAPLMQEQETIEHNSQVPTLACAMDAPTGEPPKKKQKTGAPLTEQEAIEHNSQVASLLTLCTNQVAKQINNMSLVGFLGSDEPQLPQELDSLVGSQLIKNNPHIILTLLQRITIPYLRLTGSTDIVNIWDINSDSTKVVTGHTNSINSIAISSDNKTVVTGSSDGTAKIWNINSGELQHTLTGHTYRINSVAISADSTKVVTGSDDRTAKTWNMRTGQCLQTLTGRTSWIDSVATSADSTKVVTGSGDRTAKIWDMKDMRSGQCLQTLTGHIDKIYSVATSSDRTKVVTGLGNGIVKIWDMTKFNTIYNYLHNYITIKQALFLKDWRAAQQINLQIDLSDEEKVVFDSLSDEIKEIIKSTNK